VRVRVTRLAWVAWKVGADGGLLQCRSASVSVRQCSCRLTHQALVARDELVGEAEARHQTALLEPEHRAERAREENALHRRESNAPLGERGVVRVAELQRPVGLARHARHGLNRLEQVGLLRLVLDVGVNEERVDLRVNVLDGDLEAVEAAGLRCGAV